MRYFTAFLFIFLLNACNRYYGVDYIKEIFEKNKKDLIFLKESGKDSTNVISIIGWYRNFGFTPNKLDVTTIDGNYPKEDDFYKLYEKSALAKKQIEVFKQLNLKAIDVSKDGIEISFEETGECIHLMGLDSVNYNDPMKQVYINRYKRGCKTGWIIPLDAHWYIYTDCD
jgi:hypothetical protein